MDFDVATFDCYGTLVDWEGGLACFLYDLALRSGDQQAPPGGELSERWEAIQFELVTGSYRPYREVLVESLRRFGAERGYHVDEPDERALLRSIRSWQPFPETAPALRAAQEAGLRLAIVSNTDRDILEHTIRQIGVRFDDAVTAEDCRAYKPDGAVFERALARVGVAPERVLHVAFGFKYDIGPAKRAGMSTAWVNRHAETPPSAEDAPDHEWRDLWGLAELAGASVPPIARE